MKYSTFLHWEAVVDWAMEWTTQGRAAAYQGAANLWQGRPRLQDKQISPQLRTAYLFSQGSGMRPGTRLEHREVLDYEVEYILAGNGAQSIDTVRYDMAPGLVMFRRPGQETQGVMPYSCLTVIFTLADDLPARPEPYWEAWHAPRGTWIASADYHNAFVDKIPTASRPLVGDSIQALCSTILKHHASPGEGSDLVVKAGMLQLLYHLQAPGPAAGAQGEGRANVPPAMAVKIQAVQAYMTKNLQRKLPLEELAGVAGLSPGYLHRNFLRALGKSPLDYLTDLRLDLARELLATGDLAATAVANECGFDTIPYFFTLFRRHTGMSPGEFRKRHRAWMP